MPKYRVTLEQHKEKIIRASSLDIAIMRAVKMVKGNWQVTEVKEAPEE
jgi:hypothetical protein